MNTWTISRRIIVGFAAMLFIVIALGSFAIWRGQSLNEAIVLLGDNSLPSVLTLRGCGGATRDNIFTALRYAEAGSAEERKAFEERIAANRARIDELFKKYEALADSTAGVTFVGRLATYRYYNMDQIVGQALATFRRMDETRARNGASSRELRLAI